MSARKVETREVRRTSHTAHRKAMRTARREASHVASVARFESDAVFSHLAIDAEWFDTCAATEGRFPRFAVCDDSAKTNP